MNNIEKELQELEQLISESKTENTNEDKNVITKQKKIDELNKIKRRIATIALTATLITGGTEKVLSNTRFHVMNICPLSYVFGIKHQANSINKNHIQNKDWVAVYVPKNSVPEGYIRAVAKNGKEYGVLFDEYGYVVQKIEIKNYARVLVFDKERYDNSIAQMLGFGDGLQQEFYADNGNTLSKKYYHWFH